MKVLSLMLGVVLATQTIAPHVAFAQPGSAATASPDRDTPGEAARLLEDVRKQLTVGRSQLEANQIASLETLRSAAQKTLNGLVSFIGPDILTAPPENMPTTGFLSAAARQAAEAHFLWGRAADQFDRRDEALTAYSRAIRFAGQLRGGSNTVARDSLLALGGALRDGLPSVAPDDTLVTIADIAHGRLWEPKRFSADFSNANFQVQENEEVVLLHPDRYKREFLVTSGRVFPPVPNSAVDVDKVLSRVPPLYRTIKADALPEVLRLDRMAVGYERETGGPNKGLWRQAVRVFYPSTYLTKDRRDDRARAEALCAQFLKVRALNQMALGLDNPYDKEGVTTLWLSEVSSWWPRDDDDPRVRQEFGSQMPKTNVSVPGQSTPTEVETPPTSAPWRAAGQVDSAPGEIMFFKVGTPRAEAEWLRQLFHEYGHVALPAINSFKPPLEPYANGVMGETLGALWMGSDPGAWGTPALLADAGMRAGEKELPQAFRSAVQNEVLPALKVWRRNGPVSPLRRDTAAAGLQYLQGLTIYLERVYGAPLLGQACKPLVEIGVASDNALARLRSLNTESLLRTLPVVFRDALGSSVRGGDIRIAIGAAADKKVLPVWLGGALEYPEQTVDELLSRAPRKIAAGKKATGWLYVPPAASTLRVQWQSTTRAADVLQVEGFTTKAVNPSQPDSSGAMLIDVKGHSGWQRFAFAARSDATLLAAQFEK